MATGRRAFPGNNVGEVMAAVLRDDPTELKSGRQLHTPLKHVVAHCLAKAPDQRFQSAGGLAMALKKAADGVDTSPSIPASRSDEGRADDSAFPTRPCVAVLPLQNFSGNKIETDY